MDVKALAKSKRAHTQHHTKKPHGNHNAQKLKSPSPSSSSSPSPASNDAARVPLGKQQVIEKKTNRASALPTNWDRYEEEGVDSGLEGVSAESASKITGDVVPKSKGADFRYLVAEAQSQAEKTFQGSASLDELLPWEFGVGLGSMLAIRGEGILSWVGDDNFVVEDKTTAYQEASFTSLNLHALAETLAKVDLSKRLFIESDLLPTELCVEGLALGSNEEPDKLETTEDSELANRMSKELNLDDFAADQFASTSASCSSIDAASTSTLSSSDLILPVNYVNVEFQHVGSSGKDKSFPEANLIFEAAAAEKELDMLLDSLGETKIPDYTPIKPNTAFPVSLGVSSVDPPQILHQEPAPSKIASVTASLDDALDDLLEETSTLMNPKVSLRPQEEKPVTQSILSSSHSGSKPEMSDDFDSWFDTL